MAIKQFLALAGFLSLLVCAQAQTDPAARPIKLRVSSGVAEGLKIHDVKPVYPWQARERRIQGDVILQATIDTKGNITNLRVASGDPELAEAAMKAVKQWKYRSYLLKGEPVEVETTIKIQFHM